MISVLTCIGSSPTTSLLEGRAFALSPTDATGFDDAAMLIQLLPLSEIRFELRMSLLLKGSIHEHTGEMLYKIGPETWFTPWRRTVGFPSFGLTHEDTFMPWKETRTVDQRLQFLSSYRKEEMSVTDLCHEYGISRPTAYKWIKRYDEVGPEGLLDLALATQFSVRNITISYLNRRRSVPILPLLATWDCLSTAYGASPKTMMSLPMKSTVGESLIAVLMSGVAALLAAVVGFVGAIFLCSKLFSGEATESALILAPATAIVFAVAVFVFAFWKISMYGEGPDEE